MPSCQRWVKLFSEDRIRGSQRKFPTHSHVKGGLSSSLRTEFMETSRNFQDTLIIPSATMANSLKAPANGLSAQSEGLMRYHSAPSSTFAALLASDLYLANEAPDLVQLLAHNGLNNFGGFCDGGLPLEPNQKQPCSVKDGQQLHSGQNGVLLQYSGRGDVVFEDHIGQGPLSAILEHASEEACIPQPCQGNPVASTSNGATCDSDNQYQSNLIRHSSLPTHFLSSLAMADVSERPMGSHQAGSRLQSSCQHRTSHTKSTSPMTTNNTGGKVYVVSSRMSPGGVPVRKCLADDSLACDKEEYSALDSESNQGCGLLRQSSSPAGLLSQLSLDEFANPTDKAVTTTQNLALGGWDEASMAFAMQIEALSQRKRGRDVDARSIKNLSAADPAMDLISSPRNHDSVMGASNGDMTDAALCKSRAKRGCATHPRSIAERVRRTKINERIKKLLELVPNLDKQAHTADMLDEVVEYVKLLQQRVEELSNQSLKCNGTCQKKGEQRC